MDIVLVIPEDSIILDLGTGHGLVLIKFASKISSEGHVTGIDLWKNRDQSNNSFKSTQQLLQEKNGRICLTDYGIDVSNYVLAQFLED